MFSAIGAFFNFFRKGEEVADPAKWKHRQITATMIGGLIIASVQLGKAFGYDVPIEESDANTVGAAIIIIVNVVLTLATSKKVGLLPARGGDNSGDSAIPQGLSDTPVQPPSDPDTKTDYID